MAIVNKNIALAIAALVACGTAAATEDYDLRYAPGYGGADMSAPFEGGWVFQSHAYYYSGNIRSTQTVNTDLTALISGAIHQPLPPNSAGAATTIHTNDQISVYGLLNRISYMSANTFLGATIGGTALIPLVNKGSVASVHGVSTTLSGAALALPAPNQAGVIAQVNAGATASANFLTNQNSNKAFGIGDIEVSPILRWSTEATQTLFVFTVVTPTGDYDQGRAANPSAGKFFTFRPALQFSYIGDGWDVGSRVAYSYNTRNSLTHYKSGSYVNIDLAVMKSVSESTRIGVSAYGVDQLVKDSSTLSAADFAARGPVFDARENATLNAKGHVAGVGPEVAYIHGAGDYLLEGRIMKEFDATVRPKGFTAIVSLSKPF
jgi:hypothetical protein